MDYKKYIFWLCILLISCDFFVNENDSDFRAELSGEISETLVGKAIHQCGVDWSNTVRCTILLHNSNVRFNFSKTQSLPDIGAFSICENDQELCISSSLDHSKKGVIEIQNGLLTITSRTETSITGKFSGFGYLHSNESGISDKKTKISASFTSEEEYFFAF